jgi:hypothetical protein
MEILTIVKDPIADSHVSLPHHVLRDTEESGKIIA